MNPPQHPSSLAATPLFAVVPGYVTSKNDGQRHYICAENLIRLYRVPRPLCVILGEHDEVPEDLFPLEPRYHGDYVIPARFTEKINAWADSANVSDQATASATRC